MSSIQPVGSDGEMSRAEASDPTAPPPHYPTVPISPSWAAEPSSLPPPVTPPNWYPDPTSPGILRYWDGVQWTEHRQAATPQATATVVNNVSVRGGGDSLVGLHLVLTLLTCGLWLPVWLLIEVIRAISK